MKTGKLFSQRMHICDHYDARICDNYECGHSKPHIPSWIIVKGKMTYCCNTNEQGRCTIIGHDDLQCIPISKEAQLKIRSQRHVLWWEKDAPTET